MFSCSVLTLLLRADPVAQRYFAGYWGTHTQTHTNTHTHAASTLLLSFAVAASVSILICVCLRLFPQCSPHCHSVSFHLKRFSLPTFQHSLVRNLRSYQLAVDSHANTTEPSCWCRHETFHLQVNYVCFFLETGKNRFFNYRLFLCLWK